MSEVTRVPLCPDCKEPGMPIRGDWFRCSDSDCRAIWQEKDWAKRMAAEKTLLAELDRFRGINGLLVIGEEICDNCGRVMKNAEKYCYNSNESVDDPEFYGKRGKRYCVKCSLRAGYMRMVRNTKTGREYPVMFKIANEEFVD